MVDHGDDRDAPGDEGQAGEGPGEGPGEGLGGGERVAKALARAGVASRRDVERYIAAGRVALNGRTLDTPAVKVEPGDVLTVDGAVVAGAEATRVWRHHKPAGLLTSHGDPAGRPTVFEHLPAELPRVISVGRLDLATEGLLLLTNDGELARRLEMPDNGWRRVYRARAHGRADQGRLDTLKAGVTIEGVRYGPVEARLDKATGKGAVGRGRVSDAPANLWITVTVAEGKNREVRRVLEHLGLKVNRLIRLAYGPFALGELQPGEVEEISPRVLREQLAELIAPASLPQGNRRPGPPTRGSAPPVAAAPTRAVAGRPATARSARPQGPQSGPARTPARSGAPTRSGVPTRSGSAPAAGRSARVADDRRGAKPPPRPTGAAGRVAGAWTPPGERSGRPAAGKPARAGAPGGRPPRGAAAAAPETKPRGPARPTRPARAPQEGADARAASPRGRPSSPGAGRPAAPAGAPAGGKPRSGPKPAAPGGARPRGAAPGPAAKGRGGAAAGGDAPRTGLELAPPMRRGPRRKPGAPKGPRRPPRQE